MDVACPREGVCLSLSLRLKDYHRKQGIIRFSKNFQELNVQNEVCEEGYFVNGFAGNETVEV